MCLTTSKISLLSRTLLSIGVFFLNLETIFNLPTADKSYLSALKKRLLKRCSAVSIVGGGDTVAAIEQFNIKGKISYISTAGGAFVEFIGGNRLPCIDILYQRASEVKI